VRRYCYYYRERLFDRSFASTSISCAGTKAARQSQRAAWSTNHKTTDHESTSLYNHWWRRWRRSGSCRKLGQSSDKHTALAVAAQPVCAVTVAISLAQKERMVRRILLWEPPIQRYGRVVVGITAGCQESSGWSCAAGISVILFFYNVKRPPFPLVETKYRNQDVGCLDAPEDGQRGRSMAESVRPESEN
jgi:hypothetical protein